LIRHAFGSEEQAFRLRVAEWRDVEKACDAGLGEIAARLAPLAALVQAGASGPGGVMGAVAHGALGRMRLDDVRAPLMFGLIGGGRTSTEAGALVRLVFDEAVAAGKGPAVEYAGLALAIVMQAIVGLGDEAEDDPAGEPEAAEA
jgi:hypothetical protein